MLTAYDGNSGNHSGLKVRLSPHLNYTSYEQLRLKSVGTYWVHLLAFPPPNNPPTYSPYSPNKYSTRFASFANACAR